MISLSAPRNFLLLILIGSSFVSIKSFSAESTSYEMQLKKLEQRFKDFYQRKSDIDKARKERFKYVGEQKSYRKKIAEAYDLSRRNFVESRKTKPSLEKWLPEHEKEVERLKQQQIKNAKQFADQRDRLNRVEESGKKIPDRQDVGLDAL